MGAGLLASRGVKERLEKHEDPIGFIQSLRSKGVKGQLTLDMIPLNPGRVIAPIAEVPLENIDMRNKMPDWKREDFPMDALDAMIDIKVHYDITGNSITEGKMGDITNAFNDRLERLRKLIIANSNLPSNANLIEVKPIQTPIRVNIFGKITLALFLSETILKFFFCGSIIS